MVVKIPLNNKLAQTNRSNLTGNLFYTKNINLDEEGYIKLSSRTVTIATEKEDNDFGIPQSFGRKSDGFFVATNDKSLNATVTENTISVALDTAVDTPNNSDDTFGRWFQNKWHITVSNKLWYRDAGFWTDTGVTLTSGVTHALEVFRNKNSLAVTNGNTVKLLNTSYATTVTLTIPSDYEAIGLSYSSNKMAIITKLSDDAAYQNQEAYFFTWTGALTTAEVGIPVGSDFIYSITPYKTTWIIVTRTGEFKSWNGGGFEPLTNLPFFYLNHDWGDPVNKQLLGDPMQVDGNLFYVNTTTQLNNYGVRSEQYLENMPGGVLCYDPNVGLYHRYSPSISRVRSLLVTASNVNTTTDILTITTGTIPDTGNPISYVNNKADQIGGLIAGTVYYVIKISSTTFKLATTKENADSLIAINLTAQASGNSYFLGLELRDFGASRMGRVGGVGLTGRSTRVYDHLIFGGEYYDYETNVNYETMCLTVPFFENRGYFVTSKIVATAVEDTYPKAYIRYAPLALGDEIILKYKDKELLGFPVSTPQESLHCTWSDSNTFTTTADLSLVKSYLDSATDGEECEVEVISGAGAGCMAQISTIEYAGSTYTVTLAEDIVGAAATYVCDVLIDNWKVLNTTEGESSLTYLNTKGFAEYPIAKTSKAIMFKLELRGVETTVEEFRLPDNSFKPNE